jgi:hypothetical protein
MMKQEGIVGVEPPVKQSTAETLGIDICLTSRICEGDQRWRNRVILLLFQNIRFFRTAFLYALN